MPTPTSGSLTITDATSLSLILGQLLNLQLELSSILNASLPGLNSGLTGAVSGSAVEHYMANYPAWTNSIANVLQDVQSLHNYLSPIASAVSGGAN